MSEAEIGDCDEAMKLLLVSGAGPNSPLRCLRREIGVRELDINWKFF